MQWDGERNFYKKDKTNLPTPNFWTAVHISFYIYIVILILHYFIYKSIFNGVSPNIHWL